MGKKDDLKALLDLQREMESPNIEDLAEKSSIRNPAKEVESAITDFTINKLNKLSEADNFSDLIKMYIRQKLPEASFSELAEFLHNINRDNTKATEAVLTSLFKNESSGKNIIGTLKERDVSSTAAQLYDSTNDKDVLQALTYLSQVMAKIQSK